ncbi:hypothetical protein [Georgenia thermotolerans]|uniref:Uncharacterized protein n=1 Tax=Georgenia thermotolerans TaxID=527326 RepID=A0A7J5UMW3_9MICO|nr:hypothetical protein [Georgenia thermotolerans]KAE8763728.1 hypothetical protein GB883_12570 [Georgenia thermotolerans]
MRPRLLLAVTVGAVAVTALMVARAPGLRDRLRALPADFAAAFREREAELRAALLPDDDAVAAARTEVARRRGRHAADEESDDLPYSFY